MTEYLELDDLITAATAALGWPPEISDVGLLEAALARPKASVYGAEAYPNLDTKAGALLHSIVAGHGLVDGNKRLGWVAVRLFYALNDRDLRMPLDMAFDLIVEVADGRLSDVREIADRLAGFVVDLQP